MGKASFLVGKASRSIRLASFLIGKASRRFVLRLCRSAQRPLRLAKRLFQSERVRFPIGEASLLVGKASLLIERASPFSKRRGLAVRKEASEAERRSLRLLNREGGDSIALGNYECFAVFAHEASVDPGILRRWCCAEAGEGRPFQSLSRASRLRGCTRAWSHSRRGREHRMPVGGDPGERRRAGPASAHWGTRVHLVEALDRGRRGLTRHLPSLPAYAVWVTGVVSTAG